jgi:hypothetical protein
MSSFGRAWSDLAALCWAIVGMLGGHVLTYALLFPDAHAHDAVLAESGHGWTSLLGPTILTTAVVAAGLALLRRSDAPTRGVRFALLATLQVSLFVALELGERLGSGLTLDTLQHHLVDHGLAEILLVGGLVQLVAAWLGSALSRLVADVVREPGRMQPRRLGPHHRVLPIVSRVGVGAPVRGHRSRGPPVTT